MQQISAAARQAGKHWGMPCFSVEHGRRLLDMGARFIAHGADILLVKRGLEQIQQQFGPLGFEFPRKGS
jgi:4-hydroxy-2-oxoheptanedioate aldolase